MPPRYTKNLVTLSVIARSDSRTAARAMIPTVAALRPERRAYTGLGRVSPTCAMPTERPYIPIAPGRLFDNQHNLFVGNTISSLTKRGEMRLCRQQNRCVSY